MSNQSDLAKSAAGFNGDPLSIDTANNRVGVGTVLPSNPITVDAANALGSTFTGTTAGEGIRVRQTSYTADNYVSLIEAPYVNTASQPAVRIGAKFNGGGSSLAFGTTNNYGSGITNTAMTIDASGNLLVGKTSTAFGSVGARLSSTDNHFTTDGGAVADFNRLTSDGSIVNFYKDGTTVGSIGVAASDDFYIGASTANHAGLYFGTDIVYPMRANSLSDGVTSLGLSSNRFNDIYATNGTIQTSDQNEKQQIASLTDAEMQAAKAISKLFKTFKWNDSVTEKGDDARIHSGVIAQEVEAAMSAAGLDAGKYAFFISTTWWETQTEVPAVEADEENGIEAKEAYTRTDTYDTAEEAPEGATERTRKGIRYPQLMSFIGAATEQRLASIEARLDALESS